MQKIDERRTELRTETSDWYSEGESRIVRVGDMEVHVRFVGRKGRRGRIVISAPAGARFRSGEALQKEPMNTYR